MLAEKADAKVISVSVSDSTTKITLRYGYSEATATIYTPSDAAAQWTAHIESTKLGSTTVPGSDMKCSLYKFPIKFDCFLKIMSSGSNLRHLIKKHSSHRCAVISNIKNLHTVLIPFNGLVKIRYNIKHIQILDPAPVNGIRNLDCCLIIFLFYEFFYLLRFQAIFILIQ